MATLHYTKRTIENLGSLNKKARKILETFLLDCAAKMEAVPEFKGIQIEVISGYRSPASQAALYARGRTVKGAKVTNAGPWKSWHQYGLAIDTGLFKNGVYLDGANPKLTYKAYKFMANLAKSGHPLVEPAFFWTSFPEGPHFQTTGGIKTVADARKKWDSVGGDVQKML
jgi:peptidoglycan L-alanyl-D-glutamate endopeptidase CwlK